MIIYRLKFEKIIGNKLRQFDAYDLAKIVNFKLSI